MLISRQSGTTLHSVVLLAFAICAMPTAAYSGAIDTERTASCDVRFSGELEAGDADRLVTALKAVDTTRAPRRLRTEQEIEQEIFLPRLCLDSGGGSFAEAVLFVRAVVAKLSLATMVEKGAECYSACALLFLAGHHYQGDEYVELYRRMHVDGTVGFHAPYIPAIGSTESEKLLQQSYRAGVEAVAELLNLDQRFFPRSLLAEFLKAGPDQYFKIDELRQLAAWDIGLYGYRRARFVAKGQLERACRHKQLRNDNVYQPLFFPQWREDTLEDELSTPEGRQRAPVGPNVGRHVVEGMGAEGAFKCVVLMQMVRGVLFLSVEIVASDQNHPRESVGRASFLSAKAEKAIAEVDPDSFAPAYFLYSGRTKISALSRDDP